MLTLIRNAVLIFVVQTFFIHAIQASPAMGIKIFPLQDESRPHWTEDKARPMLLHAFYPTDEAEDALTFGPDQQAYFIAGIGKRDASLNALHKQQHPLVILSHGNGSGIEQLGWLAQAFVAKGFIVLGVNHHGNTFVEPYLPQGFTHYWERPQDIRFAIDWALAESPFKEFIDADKIAVAGYSLGGYSVLAAAGAITDRDYFINNFCQSAIADATCRPSLEFPSVREQYQQVINNPKVQASIVRQYKSYFDPRIKAVVAIAPAGQIFAPDSISNIHLPTLIMVGDKDSVTPTQTNARYLADKISTAEYREIALAEHYSMISPCTEAGAAVLPFLCQELHGRDRRDIHHEVSSLATEFLIKHLYENSSNHTPPRAVGAH